MAKISGASGIVAVLFLLPGLAIGSTSCTDQPPASKLLLSDYPEPFESETMIVISGNVSPAAAEGAGQIALKLEESTGNETSLSKDTALAQGDRSASNLVLLGTPGSNFLLEQVYEATDVKRVTGEYPGQNKGILQILENPWNADKAVLIVAGSDEPGLSAAIAFLMKDDEIRELNEENAVVEYANGGAVLVPVDMLNSVMSYIKQHHSDAAAFISQDVSWTRTGRTVLPGYTENVYSGDGWTVTVGRPIVPEVFYDVRAEHKVQGIVWVGKIENGVITERSYATGK